MEVTKDNFSLVTAEIQEILPKAAFIALDLEFSSIIPFENILPTDTPIEYFYKMTTVPTKYALFTFGLSIFTQSNNQTSNEYESYSYNFYTHPNKKVPSSNKIMGFTTSALGYLNKHNTVDYDKWFKKGIPYIRNENISILRDTVHNRNFQEKLNNLKDSKEAIPYIVDTKLIRYNREEIERFVTWYETNDKEPFRYKDIDSTAKKVFLYDISHMTEIDIQLLYVNEYNNTKTHERYLIIAKQSKEETEELYTKLREKLEEKVQSSLGFNKLWDILKDNIGVYKIPVIGHNLIIDLMYLYNHLERKIDRNFFNFRQQLHSHIFPFIYDTKLISDKFGMGHLCLEDLWKALKENFQGSKAVKVQMALEKIDGNFVAHNSAYDSFITGWVFVIMKNNIKNIESYINKLKYRGNNYWDIGLTEKNVCLVKDQQTLVFINKYADYSNIGLDGQPVESDVDNQLKMLVERLETIDAIENIDVITHRFIEHIKLRKCYFVKFDGKIPIPQYKQLSKEYEIMPLKTYFDKVHSMFNTDIYKHKKKVEDV